MENPTTSLKPDQLNHVTQAVACAIHCLLLLQIYKKVFSVTTLGNLISEEVRHFQPEETSIPVAIQRTEPYDSVIFELLAQWGRRPCSNCRRGEVSMWGAETFMKDILLFVRKVSRLEFNVKLHHSGNGGVGLKRQLQCLTKHWLTPNIRSGFHPKADVICKTARQ